MYIIAVQSDDNEGGNAKKSAVQMLLFSATMVSLAGILFSWPDLTWPALSWLARLDLQTDGQAYDFSSVSRRRSGQGDGPLTSCVFLMYNISLIGGRD